MTTKAKTESPLRLIATDIIAANHNNPRSDLGDLSDLTASILTHGIIQPILVRRVEDGYECVAGSRRLAVAKAVGMGTVPCHLVEANDMVAHELALAENVVRRDMSVLDEIHAVDKMAANGDSHAEIAARFGRTPRWVASRVRIAAMPEAVHDRIGDGRIGIAAAEELAKLRDATTLIQIAEEAAEDELSLEQVRRRVADALRDIGESPFAGAGSECAKCMMRSDRQADLFGDDNATVRCSDASCWAQKRDTWIAKTEKSLRAEGHLPKPEYVSNHQFDNCYGSILDENREEEAEQIAELKEAGVKPRFRIDKETFEVILRYDWGDMPEKIVKTASGDDADEVEEASNEDYAELNKGREPNNDGSGTYNEVVSKIETRDDDDEMEDADDKSRPESPWQRRSREKNAIADAVQAHAPITDYPELLQLAAEVVRRNIGASRMDKLIDSEPQKGVVGLDHLAVIRAFIADMAMEFYANDESDAEDRIMWREFVTRAGLESIVEEAAK